MERALRDAGDAKCRMPVGSELDEALEELMAEILAPDGRRLTKLGLGEYSPPSKLGERATFAISSKGRKVLGEDG